MLDDIGAAHEEVTGVEADLRASLAPSQIPPTPP
jgi:hypothetical protein